MKNIKPLHNKVLIAMNQSDEVTSGGLVLPKNSIEVSQFGTVVKAGDSCKIVASGQQVFVSPTQGTLVKFNGMNFVLIEEDKLIAKVD